MTDYLTVWVSTRGQALALCVLLAVVPNLAQQTDLRVGLQAARAKWQQRQPSVYEFTLEARCFCIGIAKMPPTFRVRNGEPSTLTELDRDSATFYSRRDTIDKLFAAIEWSLNRGQDNSIVRYDEEFGYPLLAELDPQRSVVDDELVLRVTNFRVIEIPRQSVGRHWTPGPRRPAETHVDGDVPRYDRPLPLRSR